MINDEMADEMAANYKKYIAPNLASWWWQDLALSWIGIVILGLALGFGAAWALDISGRKARHPIHIWPEAPLLAPEYHDYTR